VLDCSFNREGHRPRWPK